MTSNKPRVSIYASINYDLWFAFISTAYFYANILAGPKFSIYTIYNLYLLYLL